MKIQITLIPDGPDGVAITNDTEQLKTIAATPALDILNECIQHFIRETNTLITKEHPNFMTLTRHRQNEIVKAYRTNTTFHEIMYPAATPPVPHIIGLNKVQA